VRGQLDRFTHTAFQVALYEPYVELAERLNAIAPISGDKKCALFSTGAEAIENAVKIARAATGRTGVVAFAGGFHGRSLLTMTMTGKVSPYKRSFGSGMPDVWHVPFPSTELGVGVDESLKFLEMVFSAAAEPSRIAAIVIEPVQGEGGFHQAPAALMSALREVADRHGILLIADEVQSGFGRTGKMFAMQHYEVEVDILCMAKSLAGGLPLSAVVGRADIMDAPEPGSLGGTYAGNPLACAASLAVLDLFADGTLLQRANAIGSAVKSRLQTLQSRRELVPITGVRGPGAMIAFDVVDRASGAPDALTAKRVVKRACDGGLVLLMCGVYGNSIRILVPLTAKDEIVEEGLGILELALAT